MMMKTMTTKNNPDPLVHKKHELIRQYDRKEIDEKTFNERFAEVREQIEENMKKVSGERNGRGS